MANSEMIRYCPKCNKKISPDCMPIFEFIRLRYSMRRFDALFFLCGDCRLACIDKSVVQTLVSNWRKRSLSKRKFPISHKKMCSIVNKKLEDNLRHYTKKLGYKIAKFNKTPKK